MAKWVVCVLMVLGMFVYGCAANKAHERACDLLEEGRWADALDALAEAVEICEAKGGDCAAHERELKRAQRYGTQYRCQECPCN